MSDRILSYDEYINESTKDIVYPTNFKVQVQGALSCLYNSIMAIAQELANEKAFRNPSRYDGVISEVDISRAINMIFHSNWKKKLKKKAIDQIMMKSVERAKKYDDVIAKKNQRAIGKMMKDKEFNLINIDKKSIRFSDKRDGTGPGSNQ